MARQMSFKNKCKKDLTWLNSQIKGMFFGLDLTIAMSPSDTEAIASRIEGLQKAIEEHNDISVQLDPNYKRRSTDLWEYVEHNKNKKQSAEISDCVEFIKTCLHS
jgi:hypothetical protein